MSFVWYHERGSRRCRIWRPIRIRLFRRLRARRKAFRGVRASAEEVLTLHPDLVVTYENTNTRQTQLLRSAGVDVLEVPWAQSLKTSSCHANAGEPAGRQRPRRSADPLDGFRTGEGACSAPRRWCAR